MDKTDGKEGGLKAGLGEGDQFVTLAKLKGGHAEKLFKHCLEQVMENIADGNTHAEATRTITLQVTIKPEADRRECKVAIGAKVRLAAVEPAVTTVYTGRHRNQLVMVESNPEQRGLFVNTPDIERVTPIAGGAAAKGAQV